MNKATDIQLENNLFIEKRDMNVYHRKDRVIHLISCGSSVIVPLQTINERDYIHLSVAVGPGYMERQNIVYLPTWINFEFLSEGKFAAIHTENLILLKIPAGLPEWKLKLTLPQCHGMCHRKSSKSLVERVIISDEEDK